MIRDAFPPGVLEELQTLIANDPEKLAELMGMGASIFDSEEEESEVEQLLDQAFEATKIGQRQELIKQALKLDPNSADAYLMLAETSSRPQESLDYFREAVAAAERKLGPKEFEECRGEFWGFHQTRPYMRARQQLADALWLQGFRDEAVTHMQEMLELNPGDNQGIRYELAGHLLFLKRHDELDQLLARYPHEESAPWAYSKTLLAFRRGNIAAAKRELAAALEVNKFVPEYLLNYKLLPASTPEYYSPGEDSEAVIYVGTNRRPWQETAGVLDWLREASGAQPPKQPKISKAKASQQWQAKCSLLRELEEVEEVWQVDIVRTKVGGKSPEETFSVLYVAEKESGSMVMMEPLEIDAKPAEVLEALCEWMLSSSNGNQGRPKKLEVRRRPLGTFLKPKLAEVGIECDLVKTLPAIDQLICDTDEMLARRERQLEVKVSPEDLRQLPQNEDEVWQAAALRLPNRLQTEDGEIRPWIALVGCTNDSVILGQDVLMHEPTSDWFGQFLTGVMSLPASGAPRRPGMIEFHKDADLGVLPAQLSDIGVQWQPKETLELIESLESDLNERFRSDSEPAGLMSSPGVEQHHGAALWEAAAEFYRHRPWDVAPMDVPIKIECDQFATKEWHAIVMGQSGMTYGVALYDREEELRSLMNGNEPEHRYSSSLVCMFNEMQHVPAMDLNAAEQHGWPVAAKNAYPWILRTETGQGIRLPLRWELQFLEAALRAIPQFLKKRNQDSSRMLVPTADGELELRLSWHRL